ncbi:MAG: CotH kinase family protein [Flavobacteriales bacterium]|nr:CotH kinase family protein [Flavobacteriales bacterium]
MNLPSKLQSTVAFAWMLWWGAAVPLSAQTDIPPYGPVFLQDEVATVVITMDPDSAEAMLFGDVDYASSNSFPATIGYQSAVLDTLIDTVAVRLRGNTSLTAPKKSFKVDLNAFIPGQKFADLEKLNLNANQNDPSILRAALSWHILRQMGLTGSRTSMVKLMLNDEYMGVYVNTEHMDEEFVEEYYDKDGGNFYKCLWPADLQYVGPYPDEYKFEVNGRRAYELKTNTEEDDYTDLATFIDVLNNTPDADFKCAIEEVFNVADFLKVMALDVISGNWDGYTGNKNNFYLYHNPQTGLFDYIPYDLDNTWGIDWVNGDWEARNPYDWATESRPLYDRLMEVPEYRDWYTHYLSEVMIVHAHPDSVSAFLDPRMEMLSPHVAADTYYPLSFGFGFEDFESATSEAAGGHVEYGINTWLINRSYALYNQLDETGSVLIAHELEDNAPVLDSLRVRAIVDGGGDDLEVTCWVDPGNGPQPFVMYDDGEHGDRQAGDGTWGIKVPIQWNWTTVDYQVQATSSAGLERWLPCEPVTATVGVSPSDLVVNELMSSNANNVSDAFGEFDDWVELFNAGSAPIELGGKYLTDNLSVPNKYALPDGTLAPGDWAFYWADNDPEQGPYHAPFTLSSTGDEIALFEWNATEEVWVLLDFFAFGLSEQDASLGRYPDGADYWVWFATPTANSTNNYAIILDGGAVVEREARVMGPNPSLACVQWSGEPESGALYDAQGRLRRSFGRSNGFCRDGLESGVYVLTLADGSRWRWVLVD